VTGRNCDFGILKSKIVSVAADATANQKTKNDYEKIAEKFHICSLIVVSGTEKEQRLAK
jgi:hypothetical protein